MLERISLDLGAPLAPGELCLVPGEAGLVVFAHADGEARTTRRSAALAEHLQGRGLGTLLFDLLGPEERGPELAQDVPLLTTRLEQALDALPPSLRLEPIGLFGVDAGAAAALVVAARRPQQVRAVVSRGGRLDRAGPVLGDLRAPTLLLVGAADPEVLAVNRQAFERLPTLKRIDVVPRATHLFLEAGTLDVVAQHASDWFLAHLGAGPAR